MASETARVNPLIVRNLSRRFGGVLALDDVSLEICAGERRAIIGTNGAGKTTLFNIINGQVAASSGAMWLFGQEVSRIPPHRRVALGLARTFQITSLFPNLSVMENMIIAVQALASCRFVFYRRVEGYRDILARTTDLLERWQLWDMRKPILWRPAAA
jgi:branched-chain amino acid transport system ATP-binding protein